MSVGSDTGQEAFANWRENIQLDELNQGAPDIILIGKVAEIFRTVNTGDFRLYALDHLLVQFSHLDSLFWLKKAGPSSFYEM